MVSIPSQYTLLDVKPIGEGGQASVYKCKDINDGKYVAFKTYKDKSDDYNRLVEIEIEILKTLQPHCKPNILCYYDTGITKEGNRYVVSEFLEGSNLEEYSKFLGTVPVKDSKIEKFGELFFEQMIPALKYIHDMGIVHRDIKCENIIYNNATGIFTLIDFGLGCLSGQTCLAGGTRLYLSKTIVNAIYGRYYDKLSFDELKRNDLYSLAVSLFYTIYYGQYPYVYDSNGFLNFEEIIDTRKLKMYKFSRLLFDIIYGGSISMEDVINKLKLKEKLIKPDSQPRSHVHAILFKKVAEDKNKDELNAERIAYVFNKDELNLLYDDNFDDYIKSIAKDLKISKLPSMTLIKMEIEEKNKMM